MDIRNAFNLGDRSNFCEELRTTSGDLAPALPLVKAFYGRSSPLYSACPGDTEVHFEVLEFATGMRQWDPLGGALYTLAHQQALRATALAFPDCAFF